MNKIYDGIIGLVVGDALGVPVEFKDFNTTFKRHIQDIFRL